MGEYNCSIGIIEEAVIKLGVLYNVAYVLSL